MRRREREVIDDFRVAGAVSRETAQSYTNRDGLSRDSRPGSLRRPDGDHQDVTRAVAIQSGRSIFRQGIISVRLAMLSQPRNYRERHALRHN
jgi:hypothetical protein